MNSSKTTRVPLWRAPVKNGLRLCLAWLAVVSVAHSRATVIYWDPEGSTTATTNNLAATWSTAAQWSTSSAQTASPTAWVSGDAACFCAGSASITTPFTVTLNSAMTIGGIFNGSLTPPGYFITVAGSGSLNLGAGADAFATGGSDGGTTTIDVPLTGTGQVALEGGDQIYFNATNTYSGGTYLGYPGVLAFTGIVNFNNGKAFGTGPIYMEVNGSGCAMYLQGTSPVTITNAMFGTNANLNIEGDAAGLTFSGPWTLPTTPNIDAEGTGNLLIFSGTMSGPGGLSKYGASTLVLSGTNTYGGGTTISNGVLSITADANLGTSPTPGNYNIYLDGGTLSASNTLTLNSNRFTELNGNSTIMVAPGDTLSYGGPVSGPATLTKSGAGTLSLGGANSYSGVTTISTGTLEADSQGGSATGTNKVTVSAGTTLSGSGIVGGAVTVVGSLAPGTPAGPATLTVGNGLTMSGGGTYVWNLATNSAATGYGAISLTSGNLALGGTSKLSINFNGTATAPAATVPFWQTQEAWTIINGGSTASNLNLTKFTTLLNGNYAAGNFTNYPSGNGGSVLLYLPNFSSFDTLYDAGAGFFGGENLVLTNFSGLALYAWSTTNASLSVSNWTLEGPLSETPLASGTSGYSRYAINVNPTVSPTYYIAGNFNTGPYLVSPVPAAVVTTTDFADFTVVDTNVAISASGVLALLPAPPVILPGSSLTNGQFQLQFTAGTNQSFTIQASTDLLNWTNIGSGTITNSPMTFIDTSATNNAYEFYRVVLP